MCADAEAQPHMRSHLCCLYHGFTEQFAFTVHFVTVELLCASL